MSDDITTLRPANDAPPATVAPHVLAIGLLNVSIHSQINLMLQQRVAATDIMNLLIEHVAMLLALVEPAGLRSTILDEIRKNLPAVLDRHVAGRRTTAGGIYVPQPGDRVQ